MTDKYLDALLGVVAKNKTISVYELRDWIEFKGTDYSRAIDILVDKKLIHEAKYIYGSGSWDLTIEPAGLHFLENGGFTHETKLKNSPLEANKIANQAKIISIIASALAAIAIIISLLKK